MSIASMVQSVRLALFGHDLDGVPTQATIDAAVQKWRTENAAAIDNRIAILQIMMQDRTHWFMRRMAAEYQLSLLGRQLARQYAPSVPFAECDALEQLLQCGGVWAERNPYRAGEPLTEAEQAADAEALAAGINGAPNRVQEEVRIACGIPRDA